MDRIGTVLVFKEGTTREEAVDALRKIIDVLEIENIMVHEYNDEYGDPVWYIP